MTACNIFVLPEAAHVYTDGAWIRPDGTLDHVRPKVLLFPHLRAVVTTQGGSDLPYLVGPHFERLFSSFDEMVDGAPGFMREPPAHLPQIMHDLLAAPVFRTQRLFLIGFSQRTGEMQCWIMDGRPTDGRMAWEPYQADRAISPPAPEAERIVGGNQPLFLPPPQLAINLMREQRGHKADIGNGVVARAVGGFCQLTTVTANGIWSGLIEQWDDVNGQPLRGAMPASPAQMGFAPCTSKLPRIVLGPVNVLTGRPL